MFWINLKTALRNILSNKVQSVISIIGLGLGLGSILLLTALIVHERSFETCIPGYRNVYKVTFGDDCKSAFPLGEQMKLDFPEVKDYFRLLQANNIQVRNLKNKSGHDEEFAFADSSIFRILGIKFIEGKPAIARSEVAISAKMARKYFGTAAPVGEVLRVKLNDEFLSLSVTGVYNDFPPTSTLFPDFIAEVSLSDVVTGQLKSRLGVYGSTFTTALNWDLAIFYTYLVLDSKSDLKSLTDKMQKYKDNLSKLNESGKSQSYGLQPVRDIYLNSEKYLGAFQTFRSGNPQDHKYYLSIALLILLISVVNYVILTRASAVSRLRDMGTRKVFGASSANLKLQLVIESNFITILSLLPAAFVFSYGIQLLNNSMNKNLSFQVFSIPVMWVLLILVVISIGTISGFLIGSRVSSVAPVRLLAKMASDKRSSGRGEYAFLMVHFTIFIILLSTVLVISKQIRFSTNDLQGINPKNILISELNSEKLQSSFNMFRDEMKKINGVTAVAGSTLIPNYSQYIPVALATGDGEKVSFEGSIMGEGMTELLGMQLVDGSAFGSYHRVPMEVIFNESSARKYKVKAGDSFLNVFHVLGIVKDFHAHSLHSPINPMVIIQQNPGKLSLLVIKTDGRNDNMVIKKLQELYSEADPDEVFNIVRYEDSISGLYTREKSEVKIMGAFSILAIALAVMGLFGMTVISVSRRTKEIGIRKVCGSSISEVVSELNRDILKWVVLSMIAGFPVAIYIISKWQQSFAYKCSIGAWIFIITGLSALLIAFLTANWRIWKASTANPVDALRYE